MVAFGVYKMSTKDADRIKDYTGMDPEDLEDDDLEAAMDDLGIEKQMVTAEDQEVGGGSEAPPAEAATSPASGGSDLDQLEKLAELHEKGILTDEEFAAKKAQILGL